MDIGDAMERLQARVLEDPELCQRLLAITDHHVFAQAVAAVAEGSHLPIEPDDIDHALMAARRRWLERWV